MSSSADPDHVHEWEEARGVRVLGLDPSLTSFGVAEATFPGDGSWLVETTTWTPDSLRGQERLRWFHERALRRLDRFQPHMVVLEGYAYAKGNYAHQIGELGGVIRLALDMRGIVPLVVPPAKLKKFVTGKGNSGKDLMLLEAYKRFGLDVQTSDEADAASLAIFGQYVRTGENLFDLPGVNVGVADDVAEKLGVSREGHD